jgi:hypothetical protein
VKPGRRDHLDLVRDRARDFPSIAGPAGYRSARIWHCGYRSLAPVADFVNLMSLAIANFPDPTLGPIEGLTRLETLSITHLPHISELGPLRHLKALKHLSLATLPSWDSSGKVTEVASLAPLADLPELVSLELFGVLPPDKRVDDLLRIPSLREVRISKYPRSEIDRLNAAVARRIAAAR